MRYRALQGPEWTVIIDTFDGDYPVITLSKSHLPKHDALLLKIKDILSENGGKLGESLPVDRDIRGKSCDYCEKIIPSSE